MKWCDIFPEPSGTCDSLQFHLIWTRFVETNLFFSRSSPTCMAAATVRYPYGYYPYSQGQVEVRLILWGSTIFIPSELLYRYNMLMFHLQCPLESIVPLSGCMIIQYYIVLHYVFMIVLYTHDYMILCCSRLYRVYHALTLFHHGALRRSPERLGDASPVLSTGSSGGRGASAWLRQHGALINHAWLIVIWEFP